MISPGMQQRKWFTWVN